MWWNACVHRLELGLYSHLKEFWENGVRTQVNSKGKIPSTAKNSPQRRIEPTTLHQVGQRAQQTTNKLFRPLDPGVDSRLRCGDFSWLSHTSNLNILTPVATLPGTWNCRVSAGTGWPGVSILWLGGVESLICNFYLSVAVWTIVLADPSQR